MFDYELNCLISPELNEAQVEEVLKKIETVVANIGTKTAAEPLRQIKLAYPVKKKNEAFFLVLEFKAETDKIGELEKELKKEKNILRFLLIRKKQEKEKNVLLARKQKTAEDNKKESNQEKDILGEEIENLI